MRLVQKKQEVAGRRRVREVGGDMTFTPSTCRQGYYSASHSMSESIQTHSSAAINTGLNIVHTKYWLLNEIPVAFFHLTSLINTHHVSFYSCSDL